MAQTNLKAESTQLMFINSIICKIVKEEDRRLNSQRADKRYPFHEAVNVISRFSNQTAHNPLEAWTMDISYQGIGFLLTTELLVSKEYLLEFKSEGDSPVKTLQPIRIIDSRQLVESVYLVNAIFLFQPVNLLFHT